jgi:hypothetical protein
MPLLVVRACTLTVLRPCRVWCVVVSNLACYVPSSCTTLSYVGDGMHTSSSLVRCRISLSGAPPPYHVTMPPGSPRAGQSTRASHVKLVLLIGARLPLDLQLYAMLPRYGLPLQVRLSSCKRRPNPPGASSVPPSIIDSLAIGRVVTLSFTFAPTTLLMRRATQMPVPRQAHPLLGARPSFLPLVNCAAVALSTAACVTRGVCRDAQGSPTSRAASSASLP